MPCIGRCGKTVSANAGLCAACRALFNQEVERKAAEAAHQAEAIPQDGHPPSTAPEAEGVPGGVG